MIIAVDSNVGLKDGCVIAIKSSMSMPEGCAHESFLKPLPKHLQTLVEHGEQEESDAGADHAFKQILSAVCREWETLTGDRIYLPEGEEDGFGDASVKEHLHHAMRLHRVVNAGVVRAWRVGGH